MAKKVYDQMKLYQRSPSDPILIISFLASSKLVRDTYCTHEKVSTRLFSFFVKDPLEPSMNKCMPAASKIAPVASFVHLAEL